MPKIKLFRKSFKLKPHILALSLVSGFLLIGAIAYASMQKAAINMIVDESTGTAPITKPVMRDCETVSSFTVSGSCGNNSYQTISYTCGTTGTLIKREGGVSIQLQQKNITDEKFRAQVCRPYTNLYNDAQAACAAACPKPIATCIPVPSCAPGMKCPVPMPAQRDDSGATISYCATSTPTPTPVSTIVPSTTIAPTPTPVPLKIDRRDDRPTKK